MAQCPTRTEPGERLNSNVRCEQNWQLFGRADAYRFAAPGTPEAKSPGWLDPSAKRVPERGAGGRGARRVRIGSGGTSREPRACEGAARRNQVRARVAPSLSQVWLQPRPAARAIGQS